MLNKHSILGIVASMSVLSFVSTAYASYYDEGYSHTKVNPQAWRAHVANKQRQYEMSHTIDKAPFPQKIDKGDVIKVDLGQLAWAAYDSNGNLVRWGQASGGRDFCPDIGKSCETVTGTYTIYRKQGSACKSNQFPVGKGGAPMPYCMHFHNGYAMHGGVTPDFNASHGCVRVPYHEAQWLNQNFVKVGKTKVSITY